jgi:hypothetical protein
MTLSELQFAHLSGRLRTFALLIVSQSAQLTGQYENSWKPALLPPILRPTVYPHAEQLAFEHVPNSMLLLLSQ